VPALLLLVPAVISEPPELGLPPDPAPSSSSSSSPPHALRERINESTQACLGLHMLLMWDAETEILKRWLSCRRL
jgi:hypothetical protein